MINIRKTIFSNWNFIRWTRLGIGIFLVYQAVVHHDGLPAFLGVLFMMQAITNTGCFGQACSLPVSPKADSTENEVIFEEIKKKP